MKCLLHGTRVLKAQPSQNTNTDLCTPLSLEEYERSPFLIAPLRKYDLAYLFDGGAAVVVAGLPWARDHTAWWGFIPGPSRRILGQGEVVTFCVYHSEIAGPAWQAHLPYTVVVVQLWYSGVKILSQLVCDDPQLVRIGLPVRVGFEAVHAGMALPQFFPLQGAEGGS